MHNQSNAFNSMSRDEILSPDKHSIMETSSRSNQGELHNNESFGVVLIDKYKPKVNYTEPKNTTGPIILNRSTSY